MLRTGFDEQLNKLREDILALGSMVQEALLESMEDLKARDIAASKKLIKRDQIIDDKRYEFTYAPDPKWCRIIEFYCPGCGTMIENEYVPPGLPLTPGAMRLP